MRATVDALMIARPRRLVRAICGGAEVRMLHGRYSAYRSVAAAAHIVISPNTSWTATAMRARDSLYFSQIALRQRAASGEAARAIAARQRARAHRIA